MNWAFKRQLLIFGILFLVGASIAGLIILPTFTKAPTCTDGKRNGTESGVDCGGSCSRICTEDLRPLAVLFARPFQVSPTLYNAVAYVENPNTNAAVEQIGYQFKLYDENNVLVQERTGTAYVGPNGRYPIFEAGINVGNRVPKRATFQFTDQTAVWIAVNPEFQSAITVRTEGETLDQSGSIPRVRAMLLNDSLYRLSPVEVTAFMYDKEDNVIAVSRTKVGESLPGSKMPIVFTWPKPFETEVVRTELIPTVNVFSAVSF